MTRAACKSKLAPRGLAILVLLAGARYGSAAQDHPGLREKIDTIFSQWDKRESPGCEIAVIKDGQIVYKRG